MELQLYFHDLAPRSLHQAQNCKRREIYKRPKVDASSKSDKLMVFCQVTHKGGTLDFWIQENILVSPLEHPLLSQMHVVIFHKLRSSGWNFDTSVSGATEHIAMLSNMNTEWRSVNWIIRSNTRSFLGRQNASQFLGPPNLGKDTRSTREDLNTERSCSVRIQISFKS